MPQARRGGAGAEIGLHEKAIARRRRVPGSQVDSGRPDRYCRVVYAWHSRRMLDGTNFSGSPAGLPS
jgi:hypothetical protein